MEIFLQQQQEAAETGGIEATTMLGRNRNSNVFLWSESSGGIYYGGNQVLTLESLEGDTACEERRRRLEIAMEETTFVVEEGDVIDLTKSDDSEKKSTNINDESNRSSRELKDGSDGCREGENRILVSGQAKEKETEEKDIEQGTALDIDESNSELRLPFARLERRKTSNDTEEQTPSNHDEDDIRKETVPGVCAICLCSYEVGDRVTYSESVSTSQSEQDIESGTSLPISRCPHAFHTDCIVQWLAKKNDALPECPCCRRPFCSVAPLTTADLLTLNPTTTIGRLRSARITGRNSGAIPLRSIRQIPMIALPVNNENGNSNDSEERGMMVLFPTPEMLSLSTRNPR